MRRHWGWVIWFAAHVSATQGAADCISQPVRSEWFSEKTYEISNQCGFKVDVPFEASEGSGEVTKGVWEVPACFPGFLVRRFPEAEDVRFSTPEPTGRAPVECYRASEHPRTDVQTSSALKLLDLSMKCAIPEFFSESDASKITLRNNFLGDVDRFETSMGRTVSSGDTLFDLVRVPFSELASAVSDENDVILSCTDDVPCIDSLFSMPLDCDDQHSSCIIQSALRTWRLKICDPDSAERAAIAITELIRGNRPP